MDDWEPIRYSSPRKNKDGYIVVKVAPGTPTGWASNRKNRGYGSTWYALEHRVILMNRIRRGLGKGETVHHRNGDRADNRLENLELFASGHPSGVRVKDIALTLTKAERLELLAHLNVE